MKSVGLKSFFKRTEGSLVLIIIVLFLVATFGTANFFSEYNLMNILRQCSIIGVIAISATLIIITGGIDLSCGAVVGLSTLMVAMGQARWGMSIAVSLVVALVVGIICGIYNGVIIHDLRVPPFIATLGSQAIIRGLIKVLSNAGTIAGLDEKYNTLATGSFLKVPYLAWLWIIVIVIMFIVLKYTTFGRNIYVLGSGQDVARVCGISIRKTMYITYGLAGFLCGIAGTMLAARINSCVPTAGTGYETTAIAASVIGGASLAGAKGAVIGTALGTVLMTLVDNVGIQFGINSFIMEICTGVLITLAVVIDSMKNRKGR